MQQNTLIKFGKKEFLKKIKRETFDYKIYEVIPSRFVESGKSIESILDTIHAIHESKIKYDYLNKNIILNQSSPIYYEILFEGKNIKFHYVLPDKYEKVLSKKIDTVFRVAAVKPVEDYFHHFENKYYCSFAQKKHFLFSLNSNYQDNNGLLENLFSVINSVLPDDKVLLQLAISPLNEKWKEDWGKANIKHKNGEDLPVHPSTTIAIIEKAIDNIEGFLDLVDIAIGVDKKEKEKYDKKHKQIEKWGNNVYRNAHMNNQKVTFNGFEVAIRVYCTSEERTRYYQKIFSGVFKILDADQSLEFTTIGKHKGDKREFIERLTGKNIFCTKELVSFLKLPDRRLQVDYRTSMENAIVNTQNIVPKELRENASKIRIGEADHKGEKFMTYFPSDVSMRSMSKVVVGPSRSGKTTAIKNFILNAIDNGDSVICIDTIRNCEIAEDVRDYMPEKYKDKLVILDYSNLQQLLPLAFNEIVDVNFESKIDQMLSASHLTNSLIGFIDSIAGFEKDDKLSPRMKKLISCSGKVVLSQPNTTIRDVIDTLMETDVRDKFIKSSGLPDSNLMIQELRRLDDGKGGTNYNLIAGIVDRVSALLNDFATETLISTPSNPAINFTNFSNEGKCVFVKLSEEVFDREALKPLVTFFYFKAWLGVATARTKVNNPKLCHLVIDEIHNYPQIISFLSAKVKEAAKFGLSFLLSSHLLVDMRMLLPNLKAAGASFLLIGGTSKENIKLLETELSQEGISLEEAMTTKKYHSLNLINFDREYCVYTSKLPSMLSKSYKKFDRSGLDAEHSKKFGIPFEM